MDSFGSWVKRNLGFDRVPCIDNDLWQSIAGNVEELHLPARSLLLAEGSVAKKIYFVRKGAARMFLNSDGREMTFFFVFENEFLTGLESMRYGRPSHFSIETIEPSVILALDKNDFYRLVDYSDETRRIYEERLIGTLYCYQQLFLSRITDSPEERYRHLIEEHPEIVRRVSQGQIASFLGITRVSLSRIRARINKN